MAELPRAAASLASVSIFLMDDPAVLHLIEPRGWRATARWLAHEDAAEGPVFGMPHSFRCGQQPKDAPAAEQLTGWTPKEVREEPPSQFTEE